MKGRKGGWRSRWIAEHSDPDLDFKGKGVRRSDMRLLGPGVGGMLGLVYRGKD